MSTKCTRCGTENRPSAKFCTNCGNRLQPASDQQDVAAPEDAPVEMQVSQLSDPASVAAMAHPSAMSKAATDQERAATLAANAPDDMPDDMADQVESSIEQQPTTTPSAHAQPPTAVDSSPEEEVAHDDALVAAAAARTQTAPTAPVANFISASEAEAASADVDEQPAANQSAAESVIETGALIGERYYVLAGCTTDDGERRYQVEDRGVCRSCNVVANGSEEEPYCLNCGAHLFDSALPWPRHDLREVDPVSAVAADDSVIVWHERSFVLVESQTEDAAPDAASAPTLPKFTNGVHLLVGQRSDVGVTRAGQSDEDSIFTLTVAGVYESIAQPVVGIFLIADGMGGHGDGEVASRIAAEVIGTALTEAVLLPILQGQALSDETLRCHLDDAIQAANQRVCQQARAAGNDMGATLTLALVLDERVYVANVGDSRTYLWGRAGLRQLSQDHSLVYNLYKSGALTEDEIYTHPRRNEIYRSLGMGDHVEADLFQEQLAPGDMLLLCCDGLWEMLHNDGIADVLMMNLGDPQVICDELVNRANVAGGEDNISVVIVRAMS